MSRFALVRTALVAISSSALSSIPLPASAQAPAPPLDRPIERPFEPDPRPVDEKKSEPLRPPPPFDDGEATRDAPSPVTGAARVRVETIRFRGNTILDDAHLQEVARPFLGRELSAADLQQLLSALSRSYVDAGYVTSGVGLPDQRISQGRLEVEVIEGRLGPIEIIGLRHYERGVLEARLRSRIATPLRDRQLEQALRLLERDPRIRRLDARLRATEDRDVASLVLEIEERPPFWTEFAIDNAAPTTVGTLGGYAAAGHDNPLGLGDRFYADGGATEGLWQLRLGYELPIGPWGTTIGFETRISDAEVVEDPFDELDIESKAQSYAATLRHPVFENLGHAISIGLIGEHRRGRTALLGRDEALAAGSDRGRIRLNLLRPFVEWTTQGTDHAIAIRTIASFGLATPTTTKSPGRTPDGRFVAWLGQFRGIYRHPRTQIELHARFDLQLANDALLPLEQFALGGSNSVRGYPRNQLVRDQGLVTSLEARLPVFVDTRGRRLVELIPFVDLGRAWNRDRVTPGKRTLSSVGLGLRLRPIPPLTLDASWAQPIRDADRAGTSLQARGLLLSARWSFR